MIYKKSKILFIGTVEFSYRALSALIENKFDIVGVLTKSESNFNSDYYDLTPLRKLIIFLYFTELKIIKMK